jgi:CheY-like chemotaxis protein
MSYTIMDVSRVSRCQTVAAENANRTSRSPGRCCLECRLTPCEMGQVRPVEFCPDVTLLDLRTPRMDGYEAALRIRQAPWATIILVPQALPNGAIRHYSCAVQVMIEWGVSS